MDRYRECRVYFAAGACVTGVQFVLVFILTQLMHFWHMVSYSISFVFATLALFFYHRSVTFHNIKQRHSKNKFAKFFATNMLGVFLTLTGVYVLTDMMHWNYLIAGGVAAAVVGMYIYTLNRSWVFGATA